MTKKYDTIGRDVRVSRMCVVYYCAVLLSSKGWMLLRRGNGVRIVSSSFSRILWRRRYDKRAERNEREHEEKRNGNI